MKKNIDPKSILRAARNRPVDQAFLKSLRENLTAYMAVHPRMAPAAIPAVAGGRNLWLPRFGFAAGLVALLGASTVFAAQGSLPGEVLYPVKLATETVRAAMTPNAKAKAILQLSFVEERVKEIQTILDRTATQAASSTPTNLDQALENLAANSDQVADYASKLKESGDLDGALHVTEDLHGSVAAFAHASTSPAGAATPSAESHAFQVIGAIDRQTEKEARDLSEEKSGGLQNNSSTQSVGGNDSGNRRGNDHQGGGDNKNDEKQNDFPSTNPTSPTIPVPQEPNHGGDSGNGRDGEIRSNPAPTSSTPQLLPQPTQIQPPRSEDGRRGSDRPNDVAPQIPTSTFSNAGSVLAASSTGTNFETSTQPWDSGSGDSGGKNGGRHDGGGSDSERRN